MPKPSGVALVYTGSHYLPEVLGLVGSHLSYVWNLVVTYGGGEAGYAWNMIKTRKTNVLLMPKGRYTHPKSAPWLHDTYVVTKTRLASKAVHPLSQDVAALAYWCERLTRPSDTIADLFVGGGAVAEAVQRIGHRSYIGSDKDPKAIRTARKRISAGTA